MKTQQKLMLAFGLMAMLVLATAVLGLRTAGREHDAFNGYVHGTAERMALANQLMDATNARAIAARNLALTDDPARLAREKDAASSAHGAVQESLARLRESAASVADPRVRELVEGIVAAERPFTARWRWTSSVSPFPANAKPRYGD